MDFVSCSIVCCLHSICPLSCQWSSEYPDQIYPIFYYQLATLLFKRILASNGLCLILHFFASFIHFFFYHVSRVVTIQIRQILFSTTGWPPCLKKISLWRNWFKSLLFCCLHLFCPINVCKIDAIQIRLILFFYYQLASLLFKML